MYSSGDRLKNMFKKDAVHLCFLMKYTSFIPSPMCNKSPISDTDSNLIHRNFPIGMKT